MQIKQCSKCQSHVFLLRSRIKHEKLHILKQFQQAAKAGRLNIIQYLATFLTLDDIRTNDNLALYYACSHGHLQVVQYLTERLTCVQETTVVQFLGTKLTVNDMCTYNGPALDFACVTMVIGMWLNFLRLI